MSDLQLDTIEAIKEAGCSSVDTFSIICCDAVYVVLSDGSYEKIGTANVHHG